MPNESKRLAPWISDEVTESEYTVQEPDDWDEDESEEGPEAFMVSG
jgi:hypothetical protein